MPPYVMAPPGITSYEVGETTWVPEDTHLVVSCIFLSLILFCAYSASESDITEVFAEIFRRGQVEDTCLASRAYNPLIDKFYDDECVLCLEPYCKGDLVVCLPCEHAYHQACIRRWLVHSANRKRTCPVCKRSALAGWKSFCRTACCRFVTDSMWHVSVRLTFGSWALNKRAVTLLL